MSHGEGVGILSKRKTRMEKVVYFECMAKGCDHKTEKLAIECSKRAIRHRSTKDMRLRDIEISIRILNGESGTSVAKDHGISGYRALQVMKYQVRKDRKKYEGNHVYLDFYSLANLRRSKTVFIYHLNKRLAAIKGRGWSGEIVSGRFKPFMAIL